VRIYLVATLTLSLLAGCVSPFFDVGRTETVLPLSRAWVNGQVVEYVTTDISDVSMAQMMGANFAPRLADTLRAGPGTSVLERVYKFPNNEQISVFQSGPAPIGAGNKDGSYSPLWRVVMVNWRDATHVRELKSEEDLLAAQDKGEVTLDVTDIVVNCPITRAGAGQALRGVR
jgi:hypothetical protein